jgi:hypothetical protein
MAEAERSAPQGSTCQTSHHAQIPNIIGIGAFGGFQHQRDLTQAGVTEQGLKA